MIRILSLLVLWQVFCLLIEIPPYLLPSPLQIAYSFKEHATILMHHSLVTLSEIMTGLIVGGGCAILLAMASTLSPRLSNIIMPIAVIKQATPTFVIAPLLVLWTGYGFASKIIITSLMVYFPLLSATFDGLRSTRKDWLDLAENYGTSARMTLLKVRFPAALPAIASGCRIAVTIAPMGAVISEWVGSTQGLGFLMIQANAHVETDLLFATILILITITLTLSALNHWVWSNLIPWRNDV